MLISETNSTKRKILFLNSPALLDLWNSAGTFYQVMAGEKMLPPAYPLLFPAQEKQITSASGKQNPAMNGWAIERSMLVSETNLTKRKILFLNNPVIYGGEEYDPTH